MKTDLLAGMSLSDTAFVISTIVSCLIGAYRADNPDELARLAGPDQLAGRETSASRVLAAASSVKAIFCKPYPGLTLALWQRQSCRNIAIVDLRSGNAVTARGDDPAGLMALMAWAALRVTAATSR